MSEEKVIVLDQKLDHWDRLARLVQDLNDAISEHHFEVRDWKLSSPTILIKRKESKFLCRTCTEHDCAAASDCIRQCADYKPPRF